jgi:rubrerythrin
MEVRAFSDVEGLRIALEMEKRGQTFYAHALRLAKRPEAKELLTRLAEEEQVHCKRFAALLNEAEAAAGEDYDEEASSYLSAIAAEIAFPGGLMALGMENGFNDPVKILLSGIQSEKDSILFYSEMLRHTMDESVKAAFGEIVREESGHLCDLAAHLAPYWEEGDRD